MKHRHLVTLLFLTATLHAQTFPRLVFFAGVDPVVNADRQRIHGGPGGTVDFMELFQPDAAWRSSSKEVQVFKLSTQFLQRSTDEQLATVLHDLRRRHIAVGMAAEIMTTSQACGNGVPGYTTRSAIQTGIDRVKKLGETIDYVAFDSPVAFGHYTPAPGCHYSIHDLVANLAPNIALFKRAFPLVVFGDLEPVNSNTLGYITSYLEFAQAFKNQTGSPISFMHADIIWFGQWEQQLMVWRKRIHESGIAFGIVIDGSAIDKSDAAWTNHAIERYELVTRNPAMVPDQVTIGSWNSFPTHFLPENQPGTLTNVLLQTAGKK